MDIRCRGSDRGGCFVTSVGFVTVGQAPRDDVTPDVVSYLPADIDVVEVGALDGLASVAEIESALGARPGEPVFVTRLRDGSSVTVDRSAVHERVDEVISTLADEVKLVCLLCTGHFPPLDTDVTVLEPSALLDAWVRGVTEADDVVGVIVPEEEQLAQTREKWADQRRLVTTAGSPYGDYVEVEAAAAELGTQPDVVVMDCIGYTPQMKESVRSETGAPVLLARSVLGKTAAELV